MIGFSIYAVKDSGTLSANPSNTVPSHHGGVHYVAARNNQ